MSLSSSSFHPQKVLDLLEQHPLELAHYAYGTAGFRYKADTLDGLFVRVGMAMAFIHNSNNTTTDPTKEDTYYTHMGIMVTASHNDESYNGIKVSNPDGSMIDSSQEAILVEWVNERNGLSKWNEKLDSYAQQASSTATTKLLLHVGRDTRSHSERLTNLAMQGARAMGITIRNHGVLTTPMLHHVVLHSNHPSKLRTSPSPTRAGYIQQLATAYCELLQSIGTTSSSTATSTTPLQIDCACGVGYDAVRELQAAIVSKQVQLPGGAPAIVAHNGPNDGPLNVSCGSEHVQKELQPPTWYSGTPAYGTHYCCSLDGDADRIVFFSSSSSESNTDTLVLLDGDKISVLIAHVLEPLLEQVYQEHPAIPPITMGVVQTAYANGASTNYLKDILKIPVVITKTGVKHLHHAALQFDIGIYFEANGHGTVLFGDKYYELLAQCTAASSTTAATGILSALPKLIHPAVGDALSDFLLVDAFLGRLLQWSLADWNTQLYTDLPSRQLKVQVADRSVVKCNANETMCLEPAGLQPALDRLLTKGLKGGRCFVRASGTEHVVRVYAEAKTRAQADLLATQTAQLVHEHCGGAGPLSAM